MGTMKESFQIKIKRPREEVFTVVNDFQQLAKASQGKVKVAPVKDKPSSGPGSEQLITSEFPGMQDIRIETLEWDAPKRVVRKFHIKDLPTTVELEFKEKDGETVVDLVVELVPESMVYKMMMPMLAKTIRDQKAKALDQVQKQLEANA
jgi:hypothetical protein